MPVCGGEEGSEGKPVLSKGLPAPERTLLIMLSALEDATAAAAAAAAAAAN